MAIPQKRFESHNDNNESKVVLTLYIDGDQETVNSLKRQVVHYAKAIGVRVE